MTILLSQPSRFEDLATPQALLTAMQRLRQSVHVEGQHLFSEWRSLIQRPDFLHSAQNLADYLALRHHDLRPLQTALMPWGLSSLGRMEARGMPNLDAVIATLGDLCHREPTLLLARPPMEAFFEGNKRLKQPSRHCTDRQD